MLEQFKFWKHAPEQSPGLEPYEPQGMPGMQPMEPDPSLTQNNSFQQMAQLTPKSDKDLELVNAKLDVIKAQLDNIMQRLDKMERQESKEKVRW